MASNPSLPPNQDDDEQEEEYEDEEEEDEDEDEDDDDFDPNAEAFNTAVESSLAEAAPDRDPPDVDIFQILPDQDQRDEEEEDEEECRGEAKGNSGCGSQSDRLASPNCPICLEPWTSAGPHRVWYVGRLDFIVFLGSKLHQIAVYLNNLRLSLIIIIIIFPSRGTCYCRGKEKFNFWET